MQNFLKFCVIGAGPSGLAAVKNLKQRGIPVDCFEREDDVGGNWYFGKPCSSVYQSTHLISSKRLTEFTDFPMPDDYPPFPSHQQVLEYLRSYARHFGLYNHIVLNTPVVRVEPAGEGWDVTLDGGRPSRRYRGVIIANGHHWDPLMPEFDGDFSGQIMHAHDYKTPGVLRGRRVLVVGAGNSGCDIAVESAQNAAATFHSLRRGYHFLPKFLNGKPIDECGERLLRWRLPLWLRRAVSSVLVRVALGSPQRYGLPKPDHKLFETHPIINSQLLYYVGHGAIRVKPNVERVCGDCVRFIDGSEEQVDLIVCATGYKLSFPFIDQQHLVWQDGRPHLYLNVFHPQHDNLFVAGLIQPDSGLWGLADYQSQLIASFIVSVERDPPTADWFRRLKNGDHEDLGHGIHYVNSPRHAIEVEHFSYRERLKRLLAKFGDNATCELEHRHTL